MPFAVARSPSWPPPQPPPSPSPAAPPPRADESGTSAAADGAVPGDDRARVRRDRRSTRRPSAWRPGAGAAPRPRSRSGVVPVGDRRSRPTAATATACCPGSRTARRARRRDPVVLTDDGEAPSLRGVHRGRARRHPRPVLGHHQEQYDTAQRDRPDRRLPGRRRGPTPWDETITTVGTRARPAPRGAGRARRPRRRARRRRPRRTPSSRARPSPPSGTSPGTFYVYTRGDPRVGVPLGLGLEDAPAVDELANGDAPFFYTLATSSSTSSTATSSSATRHPGGGRRVPRSRRRSRPSRRSPAARSPRSSAPSSSLAVSPPTALSLTYGLDELVASLSAAAQPAN